MTLISIPIKAQSEFIRLCQECLSEQTNTGFQIKQLICETYSKAIKDICGLPAWGEIMRSADMSMPDGVDSCNGIPIYFKGKNPPDPSIIDAFENQYNKG